LRYISRHALKEAVAGVAPRHAISLEGVPILDAYQDKLCEEAVAHLRAKEGGNSRVPCHPTKHLYIVVPGHI
jgi:hypothetical protein